MIVMFRIGPHLDNYRMKWCREHFMFLKTLHRHFQRIYTELMMIAFKTYVIDFHWHVKYDRIRWKTNQMVEKKENFILFYARCDDTTNPTYVSNHMALNRFSCILHFWLIWNHTSVEMTPLCALFFQRFHSN